MFGGFSVLSNLYCGFPVSNTSPLLPHSCYRNRYVFLTCFKNMYVEQSMVRSQSSLSGYFCKRSAVLTAASTNSLLNLILYTRALVTVDNPFSCFPGASTYYIYIEDHEAPRRTAPPPPPHPLA